MDILIENSLQFQHRGLQKQLLAFFTNEVLHDDESWSFVVEPHYQGDYNYIALQKNDEGEHVLSFFNDPLDADDQKMQVFCLVEEKDGSDVAFIHTVTKQRITQKILIHMPNNVDVQPSQIVSLEARRVIQRLRYLFNKGNPNCENPYYMDADICFLLGERPSSKMKEKMSEVAQLCVKRCRCRKTCSPRHRCAWCRVNTNDSTRIPGYRVFFKNFSRKEYDDLYDSYRFLSQRFGLKPLLHNPLQEEPVDEVARDDEVSCPVCVNKIKFVVSCGHAYCDECSVKFLNDGKCPYCQQSISTRQKIFLV